MHVSRLEIFGFKSFMDRLVLPIDKGITGIVGPNGCGKSNIIDALRWVLGETRAKSLRGGTLEDVIFNGTNKLRPLGLAEVSLTLRSQEENFFADLTSPALEAELFAEEAEARAIEELEEIEKALEAEGLAEGGAASEDNAVEEEESEGKEEPIRPALKVIQGGVADGEDSAADSQQSEEAGAEAASESTEATSEEGEAPEENASHAARLMNRFSWLKSMNEVQVTRRYYRSGESEFFVNRVPCRLKDLKELYRAVGLGARTYTIVAQGEVSRVVTAKSDERRRILEEAAGVQGFRDKIKAANRRLADTDNNIARLEDIHKEMERQIGSLKRQASKARNREIIKAELASIEKALFRDRYFELKEKQQSVNVLQEAAAAREEELRVELVCQQTDEEDARAKLMEVDFEGDELRSRIDNLKETLGNRSRQRTEKLARLKELRAFSISQETELLRAEERKGMLTERRGEAEAVVEELRTEAEELAATLEAIDLSGLARMSELTTLLEQGREELKVKGASLRQLREELIKEESRLESIDEQLVAASPINQLKKTLDEDGLGALRDLVGDARLLVDGVKVTDKYARALQAVLAERAAFLVSEQPFTIARHFLEHSLSNVEDATGMGLGVVRQGSGDGPSLTNVPFRRMLDLVEVEESCSFAVERMLSNVYFVEELETGLRFFEGASEDCSGVVLVTPEGDLITDHSFYSFRHEAGVVQLKQEADALRSSLGAQQEEVSTLQEQVEGLSERLEEYQREYSHLAEETQRRQEEARRVESQLGAVRGRLDGVEHQFQQLAADEERLEHQIAETRLRMQEYLEEQAMVQAEIDEMRSDEEDQMQEELHTLLSSYSELDGARSDNRTRLGELVQSVEETRRQLDRAKNKVSQALMETQRITLEEEHLRERVVHEYGEGAYADVSDEQSEVPRRVTEEERTEHEQRASKIRARILREGDVDPSSIQLLETELHRLAELKSQKQDLERAAITLRKTIERLTETSEQRFMATFERVRENFSLLIPKLFGGGRGSLELTDPANPLDSGLEIVARPPGKKLKSIELLSGGEKALCATSLIFALFLERPSPLCVLDEVDAPLDDANQVRFVNMVREMSSRTQFLMITHNKISMQAADNLVGVTMQTPGASKVLSVSLQEAIQQVA